MKYQTLLHQGDNSFSGPFRVFDGAIILISLLACCYIHNVEFDVQYLIGGLVAIISFAIISETFNLYQSWRAHPFQSLIVNVFLCMMSLFALLLTLAFFSKASESYSRVVIGLWFISMFVSLIGWRYLFRKYLFYIRSQGYNHKRVAVLGYTDLGLKLLDQFYEHDKFGYDFVGFYDDRSEERLGISQSNFFRGNVDKLLADANAGEIDQIYISFPLKASERIAKVLERFGNTTVDVHIVPDFFTFNLINSRLSNIGNLNTLSVYESPHIGSSEIVKRIEDVCIATGILLLITIPMLLIALAIKLTSKGPVLFKQNRYGLDGKKIQVWKFRSMTVLDNGNKVVQVTKNDARVTRLGAILRKTSLDELPQFINVITGSMSIVGPRPHAVAHNEEYRDKITYYMLRHKVKPGITGLAQINGWRGETDTLEKMEKRVEYDLQYMRSWSVWLDIKIILLTIFKGFNDKNAY